MEPTLTIIFSTILAKSQPLLAVLGVAGSAAAVQLVVLAGMVLSTIIILSLTICLGVNLYKGYKIKKAEQARAAVELAVAELAEAKVAAELAAAKAAAPLTEAAAARVAQAALVRTADDNVVDPQLLKKANARLADSDAAVVRAEAPSLIANLKEFETELKIAKLKVYILNKQPAQGRTKAQIRLEKVQANFELLKCSRNVLAAKYEASQACAIAVGLQNQFDNVKAVVDAKVQFVTDKAIWDAYEEKYPTLLEKAKKEVSKAKLAVQKETEKIRKSKPR